MPSRADKYFVKAAVKNGLMTEAEGNGCLEAIDAAAAAGREVAAWDLVVERGIMPERVARKIQKKVGEHLRDKMQPSPDSIEGYELLDRLGEGATGVVYRARQKSLDKIVAIKVLLPKYSDDETYLKRFLREAKAAAKLQHPNIVQAFDVGLSGGFYYLAMEFVAGGTLKDLLKGTGAIPEERALKIVRGVASALAHVRTHQIVHRDVKPANIFLTAEGDAKLGDLGLVRDVALDSSLTLDGKAVGTPYYMAPEQALEGSVDHRGDIYALGATLFHVVTGRVPYDGPSPTAVMTRAVQGHLPDPRSVNPQVSEGTASLIRKMMARDPERRFQEPSEVIAAIDAILDGRGFRSGDLPRVKRKKATESATPERRSSSLLAAGAVGVALLAAAAYIFLPGGNGGEPGREPAAPRRDVASNGFRPNPAPERTPPPRTNDRGAPAPQDRTSEAPPATPSNAAAADAARATLLQVLADGTALRAAGRLADLLECLESARATVADPEARRVFEAPIADLRREMADVLNRAQAQAEQLVQSGDTEGAVRLYEGLLPTQEAGTREAIERRVADLRRELARAAEVEEARYAALLAEAAVPVRAHDVETARSTLSAALASLRSGQVRGWIQEDLDALAEAAEYLEVARRAFARLAGTEREVARRQGGALTGRIVRVDGDTVVLGIRAGEMGIRIADLTEESIYDAVEAAYGRANPAIARKYGLLRLYEGDVALALSILDEASGDGEPAPALARADTFREAFPERGSEVVGNMATPTTPAEPEPAPSTEPPAAPATNPPAPAASEDLDRDRYIATHIDDLFAGEVMYYDPQTREVEVRYGFVFDLGALPEEDWSVEGGLPRYDAAARVLKFEGDPHLLVHNAVFLGECRLSIDLRVATSFNRDADFNLFVVAADDARRQLRSPFGLRVIDVRDGRAVAATNGRGDPRTLFGSGTPGQQVGFEIRNGFAIPTLDGDAGDALPAGDLSTGRVRVGIDYRRINLEVTYITVRGRLDPVWASEEITRRINVRAAVSPRTVQSRNGIR